MELQIRGTDQLVDLSRALKAAGDTGLRKELLKGIRDAAKPLVRDVKESARTTLPRAGGLNETVAKSSIGARTRTSGRSPGVRIVGKGRGGLDDIRATDRGVLRHPVFGSDTWVTQTITSGWWSTPLENAAPVVRRELIKAMEDVARKIARSA